MSVDTIASPGSSEIWHVPPVLLTERAFRVARSMGYMSIEPDGAAMEAVGRLTQTEDLWIPDITIIRDYGKIGDWDERYTSGAPDIRYVPATELPVQERPIQTASARGVHEHIMRTGKKLVELMVRDWDQAEDELGERLTFAIEEATLIDKGFGKRAPEDVVDSLGTFAARILRIPKLDSARGKRVRAARSLHPYKINEAK